METILSHSVSPSNFPNNFAPSRLRSSLRNVQTGRAKQILKQPATVSGTVTSSASVPAQLNSLDEPKPANGPRNTTGPGSANSMEALSAGSEGSLGREALMGSVNVRQESSTSDFIQRIDDGNADKAAKSNPQGGYK